MLQGPITAELSLTTQRLRTNLSAIGIAVAGAAAMLALTTHTGAAATPVAVGGAVFALITVWLFLTQRVELAIGIGIAYMGLLDGVLRLETGSSTLTIARDVTLYAVSLGTLLRSTLRGKPLNWPPLTAWILGWAAFVVVQLANPDSGPTLHRVISMRQDLEFVPVFFLGWSVVRSTRQLRGLLGLILAIGAINGGVSLVQSTMSPAQLSSWGSGYYAMIHGTAGGAPTTAVGANGQVIVRPPALGGDMGFGGAVGMLALPCGLALLMSRRRGLRGTLLICAGILGSTLGVLTSQSRTSILCAVIGLIALAMLLAASKDGKRVVIGLGIIAAIVAVSVSILSGGALHRYSSIAPNKLAGTVGSSRAGTTALIPLYASQFPFGAGIGSSGPAWSQYGSSAHTLNGESQLTFLIGEVGVPGTVLFILFQGRVLGGALRRVKRVRDREARVLIAGLSAPLFGLVANWYVGINTVSPPNAPYMWGAFGVLAWWLFRRGALPQG